MRLNVAGFVAAIIAIVSILLPWWGMSSGRSSLSVHPWGVVTNLAAGPVMPEVANITSALGVDEGVAFAPSGIWYVPTAMALVIVGAVLGFVGSSMTERKGKMLLASAGVLMVLSVVIFVVGLSSDTGELFFTSHSGFSTYFSLGFVQVLVAAVLAFFSLGAEPRSPVMPRLKMKRMEVWLLTLFIILLYVSIVFGMLFTDVKLYYHAERYIPMLSISIALILLDFPVAMMVAIAASLSIREEEEEKTMPIT